MDWFGSLIDTGEVIEWLASLSALLGAALLASHSRIASYGWLCFLLSNIAWITVAINTDQTPLLVMQLGFTITSAIGLYQSRLFRAKK